MKQAGHHVLMSLILAVFWMFATGAFTWPNVALGAVVGLGCALAGRESSQLFYGWPNPWAGLQLLFEVTYGVLKSGLQVAYWTLKPRQALEPAIVAVPVELKGDFSTMLFANLITLTPGSLSVAFDSERRLLYVHTLRLRDEEALIAQLKRDYETPIRKFFEG